ncbi:MAG: triosephosphate isomerase, partial [Verrucomicrobia bacterium]|nr:triosephosphate isomerase [Verrucomicrobiota bacterium]
LGHSERRHLLQETDEMIHKKIVKAVTLGLQPILCIGETLAEKESGLAESVLQRQLTKALYGLSGEEIRSLIIAYEPVWAIGTGVNATPDLADSMHRFCRDVLCELFGNHISDFLPILYGGSVKPDNIAGFLSKEHIDGALVGGASLDPLSFLHIIQSS